jgi:hypothetical protein
VGILSRGPGGLAGAIKDTRGDLHFKDQEFAVRRGTMANESIATLGKVFVAPGE